jgi:hypothetical protein
MVVKIQAEVFWVVTLFSVAVGKMEVTWSFETVGSYQNTTQCQNPENLLEYSPP